MPALTAGPSVLFALRGCRFTTLEIVYHYRLSRMIRRLIFRSMNSNCLVPRIVIRPVSLVEFTMLFRFGFIPELRVNERQIVMSSHILGIEIQSSIKPLNRLLQKIISLLQVCSAPL